MPRNVQTAMIVPLVLALAGLGTATHGCNGDIITIPAGSETLYIDDRSSAPGDYDHWWYLESNGMEGLQSGGDACVPPSPNCGPGDITFTDPCAHAVPDTLIA